MAQKTLSQYLTAEENKALNLRSGGRLCYFSDQRLNTFLTSHIDCIDSLTARQILDIHFTRVESQLKHNVIDAMTSIQQQPYLLENKTVKIGNLLANNDTVTINDLNIELLKKININDDFTAFVQTHYEIFGSKLENDWLNGRKITDLNAEDLNKILSTQDKNIVITLPTFQKIDFKKLNTEVLNKVLAARFTDLSLDQRQSIDMRNVSDEVQKMIVEQDDHLQYFKNGDFIWINHTEALIMQYLSQMKGLQTMNIKVKIKQGDNIEYKALTDDQVNDIINYNNEGMKLIASPISVNDREIILDDPNNHPNYIIYPNIFTAQQLQDLYPDVINKVVKERYKSLATLGMIKDLDVNKLDPEAKNILLFKTYDSLTTEQKNILRKNSKDFETKSLNKILDERLNNKINPYILPRIDIIVETLGKLQRKNQDNDDVQIVARQLICEASLKMPKGKINEIYNHISPVGLDIICRESNNQDFHNTICDIISEKFNVEGYPKQEVANQIFSAAVLVHTILQEFKILGGERPCQLLNILE
jgi:hypothetical protein